MDDESGASVAEQGMAVAAERHVFIFNLEMGFAVFLDREVGIVAGMVAFGIIETMFLTVGIEMRSGRFEIRRFAFRVLMKVDGMFARREALEG